VKKKYKKHKGITGYTLHNKRLVYSGNSSIRSIKLPLKFNGNPQILQDYYDSLIYDYEKMNGPVNISTFFKDPSLYSLFNFWLDCLRVGVIFASSTASLQDTVYQVFGVLSPTQKAIKAIPEHIRKELNEKNFIEKVLLSEGMRSRTEKDSFINKMKKCFDIPQNTPEQELPGEKLIILETIQKIAEKMFVNGQVVDYKTQKDIWKEELNVEFPQKPTSKSTFYIIPKLLDRSKYSDLVDLEHITPIDLINNFKSFVSETWGLDEENKAVTDKTKSLVGLDSKFNGFSNFLNFVFKLLLDADIEQIKQKLNEIFDLSHAWNDNITDLDERLIYLSQKAKKLGKPKFRNGWHEYRSVFGGKLSSWFSNLLNQEKEIREQLIKHREEIEEVLKFVINNDSSSSIVTTLDSLKGLSETILNSENILEKEKEINLYREILSEFKFNFNYFYQKNSDKKNSEKDVKKAYPNLFKNLRVIPNFFGGSKYEQYDKYVYKTFKIINEGTQITLDLEKILLKNLETNNENIQIDKEYFQKQLQTLLNKIKTDALEYKEIKNIVELILKKYNNGNLPKEFEAFYVSPYSRDKRLKQINLPDELDFTQELLNVHKKLSSFNVGEFNADIVKFLSFVEILKIRIGWVLNLTKNNDLDVSRYDFTQFEKAKTYVDNFGTILKNDQRNIFINNFILSEIRGALSKASRKEFTERFVIQYVDSEKKNLLVYVPNIANNKNIITPHGVTIPKNMNELLSEKNKETKNFRRSLFFYPHRWKVSLFELKKVKNSNFNALSLQKKNFTNLVPVNIDDDNTFDICTSKYQIHFLDRLLYQTKKWKRMHIEFSSPALILEVKNNVKWDLETQRPHLSIKQQVLYINYPINLKAEESKNHIQTQAKNYLGIDTGEYGLAWVALDFSDLSAPKLLDKGFIYDDSLRKIRDRVDEIKDTQIKGTFGIPSTKLARIRKHTITTLRNKVHDLLLKYNAKVIYEYSISNFETGSQRVTKIYRSIKVSDVFAETDADKSVKKLVWGKENFNTGNHISAYATSYTCSKCCRSIYFEQEKQNENVVVEKDNNLLKVKLREGVFVWAYSSDKSISEGSVVKNEDLIKMVREYARPPENSEALKRVNPKINDIFEKRGSSVIFICPYDDCNHLSDADIQAAQNIAIKGFLSDLRNSPKRNSAKINDEGKLQEFIEYIQNPKNKVPIIELIE
jgi:hypothetical protein